MWATWAASALGGLVLAYLGVVGLKFGFLRLRGHALLCRALAARPRARRSPGPPRITFVCPVTRPDMARGILGAGLDELDEPAERLFYDNTGPQAMVAARLFNHLAAVVNTPFVAFCHQDWRPVDRDWIARTLAVFDEHPRCGMVAQIGVAADKDSLGGRILDIHGYNGTSGSHLLHAPDEQCFVLRTARLAEHPFDEAALPEFHFYAVDYAQELQRAGFEVWSTPALAFHASAAGALTSKSFQRAREVLRAKWGPGHIRATTGWV